MTNNVPHEAWCDRRCDCAANPDLEDDLTAEVTRLKEALQKYGHHIDVGAGKHCAIYPIERGRPCDCGFSKALGE